MAHDFGMINKQQAHVYANVNVLELHLRCVLLFFFFFFLLSFSWILSCQIHSLLFNDFNVSLS